MWVPLGCGTVNYRIQFWEPFMGQGWPSGGPMRVTLQADSVAQTQLTRI